MRLALFALVLAFACFLSVSATPTKPVWPTGFVAPFGLYNGNVNPQVQNASATIYYRYDETIKAQRIQYHTNCAFLPGMKDITEYPCDIYFQGSIHVSSTAKPTYDCCLLLPFVGPVPPTFLQGFDFNTSNVAAPDMYGQVHKTNLWSGPEDFQYWTDMATGHDVMFQDGPTGNMWQWGKFNVENVDPSTFKLPGSTLSCLKPCLLVDEDKAAFESGVSTDPFVNLAKTLQGRQ